MLNHKKTTAMSTSQHEGVESVLSKDLKKVLKGAPIELKNTLISGMDTFKPGKFWV